MSTFALAPPARAGDGLFDRPVDASTLAGVRGGFAMPGGVSVSFDVQRAVRIDGVPVATAGDAAALLLVQRGAGNSYAVGTIDAGTVVQNTLANQRIEAITTLDATVTALQSFRSLNLQSMLRNSIADSLRR